MAERLLDNDAVADEWEASISADWKDDGLGLDVVPVSMSASNGSVVDAAAIEEADNACQRLVMLDKVESAAHAANMPQVRWHFLVRRLVGAASAGRE